jgi:peptidoglycan/xylan/chitin deacetylase (PgdA/CDA1 family)
MAITGPFPPGALAQAEPANQCWSKDALAGRPGENRIVQNVASAFVPAPVGRLDADPVPADKRGVIRRVDLPPGVKRVAFTFDLCEQPYEVTGYDSAVVDFLREEKVKATFFGGGKWMLTHQERAQQILADSLFEMANHTWEHRNLRLLSGRALHDEIAAAQLAYAKVYQDLGRRQCSLAPRKGVLGLPTPSGQPSLFRFPFGACNEESLRAVGDAGLLAIQWDVSSGDPTKGLPAEKMVAELQRTVRPGSIVLFHANGRGWQTAKALRMVVPALRRRGYEFVTVTELLNSKGARPLFASTCFDRRPGDTDHYDALAVRLEAAYRRFRERFAPARRAPLAADPGARRPQPPVGGL